MMQNNTINKYLKNVSKYLHCSKEKKQVFLLGLKQEIFDFPDCQNFNLVSLQEMFGLEKDVADALLDNLDQDEQQQYSKHYRKKKYIVLIVILSFILIVSLFLIHFYCDLIAVQPTEVIDVIKESESVDLTDDEFNQF